MAEILSRKYDLYYFKVDAFLSGYMRLAAARGYPTCKKVLEMSAEQTWMRDPVLQCREEFEIYEEIFAFVLADLQKISSSQGMITEGAAYAPALIKRWGLESKRYFALTPTETFQISHYKERSFVPHIIRRVQ